MITRTALLAIAATAIAAEAAAADWISAEAQVRWSHEPRDTIIVEDTVWRCAGDVCKGRVIDTPLLTHRACRAIARFTDGVARFSTETGEFGRDQLARCNGRR